MLSIAVALSVLPLRALADCGDDVAGRRVPCGCGDIVASDVRLLPGDPVLVEPCVGDGLLARPPLDGRDLVIDLNGQEIAGTGVGAGVRVLPGGNGSVQVLGGIGEMRGTLRGFGEGVRAIADGALARVTNVTVLDSTGTGVRVRGSGVGLEGVRVEGSGGDGIRTSGRSVELRGVEAHGSARRGVVHRASGAAEQIDSRDNAQADHLRDRGGTPMPRAGEEPSR